MNTKKVVKTAVSLPKHLFGRAEALRRKRGLSRSGLYVEALEAYFGMLEVREKESLYEEGYRAKPEDLREISAGLKASLPSLGKEEW